MLTHVEFRSDQFPPYDLEDLSDTINKGVFGKRLAEFLADGLKGRGFEPGEPYDQDWGWVVPIKNVGFPLWIGCGNYYEYEDGFLCFIEPHKPVIRRWFRKIDTTARVGALRDAMDKLLSANPGVRNKRWWTYEEFLRPGAAKNA